LEPDTSNVFDALPDDVKRGVAELGWKEPMPVQALALPVLQRGVDVIVQARTGSGKTGAFGLPTATARSSTA
jgi:ATP-dependent RNA helicase DeaD